IQDKAGIAIGDKIRVGIEADTEERVVAVPADLAKALRPVRKQFDALSYSHRLEYVRWVEEAKKEETRARREGREEAVVRPGEGALAQVRPDPRISPQRVQIGISPQQPRVAEPAVDRAVERRERRVDVPRERVRAGQVVQRRRLPVPERHRALVRERGLLRAA